MTNTIKKFKLEIRSFFRLAINDFKMKYTNSVLGPIWGFINPLITVLIYWFVFQVGLRSGSRPDGTPFIIWMICGMIPWFYFSDAVGAALSCFSEYAYLVKKVFFRKGLLPFLKNTSSLIIHLIFLLLCLVIVRIYGYSFSLYTMQIFYYLLCNIAWSASISLLVSTLNVFIKDVGNIVGIFIQMGFWLNPIVWGSETFGYKILFFLKLNPTFYIIEGYRDSLFQNISFMDKALEGLLFWIITFGVFCVGYHCFQKLKHNFADLL